MVGNNVTNSGKKHNVLIDAQEEHIQQLLFQTQNQIFNQEFSTNVSLWETLPENFRALCPLWAETRHRKFGKFVSLKTSTRQGITFICSCAKQSNYLCPLHLFVWACVCLHLFLCSNKASEKVGPIPALNIEVSHLNVGGFVSLKSLTHMEESLSSALMPNVDQMIQLVHLFFLYLSFSFFMTMELFRSIEAQSWSISWRWTRRYRCVKVGVLFVSSKSSAVESFPSPSVPNAATTTTTSIKLIIKLPAPDFIHFIYKWVIKRSDRSDSKHQL